jgi:hypothetical protein
MGTRKHEVLALRAGRRMGLRSVIFVELTNVTDKKHGLFPPRLIQPGLTLRLGARAAVLID